MTDTIEDATGKQSDGGAPEKRFWSGTNAPDDKQIPIGTFRCSGCGYLESFASAEFGAA
ncbi:MAG TPA: hypothetical protein VHW73_03835 [Rudaea sp.]|jgi:hypothetical protein|nr:hypothetical protein [Rudaea sp.]